MDSIFYLSYGNTVTDGKEIVLQNLRTDFSEYLNEREREREIERK
jgi:hypothetical protein